MPVLAWLEHTGLSTWVRESPSLLAYPTILFLHTVGLAFLVGPSVAIGARVMGFARRLPLWPMEEFYPVMWWGFWINVVSGAVLLMADATTKLTNWDFYLKLVFIAVAMTALVKLRSRVFRDPNVRRDAFVPSKGAVLSGVLIVSWIIVIAAGRFMAYLGPVSGAPSLSNGF